jgi:hypothetical protein
MDKRLFEEPTTPLETHETGQSAPQRRNGRSPAGGCHLTQGAGTAMNKTPGEHREPGRYELRIKGHLDDCWAEWFEGLALTRESDGTTMLCGPVIDQAALHGLLSKVRDLGVTLISVAAIEDPGDVASTHKPTKPAAHGSRNKEN